MTPGLLSRWQGEGPTIPDMIRILRVPRSLAGRVLPLTLDRVFPRIRTECGLRLTATFGLVDCAGDTVPHAARRLRYGSLSPLAERRLPLLGWMAEGSRWRSLVPFYLSPQDGPVKTERLSWLNGSFLGG